MKEQTRKESYPNRGGIEQHHGCGRAAKLNGILQRTEKNADAPKTKQEEVRSMQPGFGQFVPAGGIEQEAKSAKAGPPKGYFLRGQTSRKAEF